MHESFGKIYGAQRKALQRRDTALAGHDELGAAAADVNHQG